MKTVKSLGLSEELWERIEKARGNEKRSPFVERLLWEAPPLSKEEVERIEAEARARSLEHQRGLVARQFMPSAFQEARREEMGGLRNIAENMGTSGAVHSMPEPPEPPEPLNEPIVVPGRKAGRTAALKAQQKVDLANAEPVIYMCPEERCFQTAPGPGPCPSHRTKRMVRVGGPKR